MLNIDLKQSVATVVSLIFIFSTLSGCSPEMRKKFVRQKKKEEDLSFVPVLEPVDYPNQLETVKTRYDYFYALLKVWHKDAVALINDEYTDKQIIYTIRQIRIQLEELEKLLNGSSMQKVIQGKQDVDEVLEDFNKPKGLRNQSIVRKRIERLRKNVVLPLAFEKVKDDLNAQVGE